MTARGSSACGRFASPGLVIHGTDDTLLSIEHGRDTAASIPGCVLIEVAGMGHDLEGELRPDDRRVHRRITRGQGGDGSGGAQGRNRTTDTMIFQSCALPTELPGHLRGRLLREFAGALSITLTRLPQAFHRRRRQRTGGLPARLQSRKAAQRRPSAPDPSCCSAGSRTVHGARSSAWRTRDIAGRSWRPCPGRGPASSPAVS